MTRSAARYEDMRDSFGEERYSHDELLTVVRRSVTVMKRSVPVILGK